MKKLLTIAIVALVLGFTGCTATQKVGNGVNAAGDAYKSGTNTSETVLNESSNNGWFPQLIRKKDFPDFPPINSINTPIKTNYFTKSLKWIILCVLVRKTTGLKQLPIDGGILRRIPWNWETILTILMKWFYTCFFECNLFWFDLRKYLKIISSFYY